MACSFKITLAALLIGWLAGCGNDNSSSPLPSGEIGGTVDFIGAEKPDGQVWIRLWRSWPTSAEPILAVLIGNTNGQQAFRFTGLPLATYEAITVDWIADDDAALNRVIGVYWANSDSVGTIGTLPLPVQPQPVTLTTDNPTRENILIKADHNLVK